MATFQTVRSDVNRLIATLAIGIVISGCTAVPQWSADDPRRHGAANGSTKAVSAVTEATVTVPAAKVAAVTASEVTESATTGSADTASAVSESSVHPVSAESEPVRTMAVAEDAPQSEAAVSADVPRHGPAQAESQLDADVKLASHTEIELSQLQLSPPASRPIIPPLPAPEPQLHHLQLRDVVASIHSTYPLLEAAYQEQWIALGNRLSAQGAFDTKLKGASENQPLGFYENYRHRIGFNQPVYHGGEVFGGYRIGRGEFEPWYKERQTKEGGEFKAGAVVPLLRNREIDERRAELWRADYDLQRANPEIRAQLIQFVRDGSITYWDWVAAGRKYEIGRQALELAQQRNDQLRRRVEVGDLDPPVLQDNLRAIAQREAKLIDLRRKLQQAGVKLSLFYRQLNGQPMIPVRSQLTDFPEPRTIDELQLASDIALAFSQRPELAILDATASRVNVDLAEARNNMLPSVDAQLTGSQDVGYEASKKRDKAQFELEASLFLDVPLQRRKARGKSHAALAKLRQLTAKRRFTEDKIRAELQSAYAALTAALERLEKARESRRLADYMADVERRRFQLGESDLLAVVLREQSAIEAAEAEVDALLEYFAAHADYDAAMARDWPE